MRVHSWRACRVCVRGVGGVPACVRVSGLSVCGMRAVLGCCVRGVCVCVCACVRSLVCLRARACVVRLPGASLQMASSCLHARVKKTRDKRKK